jgi:hypothetical protein
MTLVKFSIRLLRLTSLGTASKMKEKSICEDGKFFFIDDGSSEAHGCHA